MGRSRCYARRSRVPAPDPVAARWNLLGAVLEAAVGGSEVRRPKVRQSHRPDVRVHGIENALDVEPASVADGMPFQSTASLGAEGVASDDLRHTSQGVG